MCVELNQKPRCSACCTVEKFAKGVMCWIGSERLWFIHCWHPFETGVKHRNSRLRAEKLPARQLPPLDSCRLVCGNPACFANSLQVLLSQSAWEAVKPTITQHPGAAQVRCVGCMQGR